MKNRYFRHIEIDQKILKDFLNAHPRMANFVSTDFPFHARISKKPYVGLIHTILSQDVNNETLISQWNQLVKVAKKIKAKRIDGLTQEVLANIVGEEKAKLIKQLTYDILIGKIDLDKLRESDDLTIVNTFRNYPALSINSINLFLIFSYFKNDVLCDTDNDFMEGLKIFLDKQNIEMDDINNIKIEYRGQLTLFSLCMWKIKNERSGK